MAVTDVAPGGFKTKRVQTDGTTINKTIAKPAQGRVLGYHVTNTGSGVRYLKLYDQTTLPNPASDVPLFVVPMPSGQPIYFCTDEGISFGNGVAFTITTGAADTDATAPAVNDVQGALWFA